MAFDPSTARLIDIPESSGFDPKTAKLITDHPETKQRQWGEIPRESLSNVLPSSARLVKETAEAVLHPIDTAQSVLDLSNAAMQSVLPDSVRELMYKINPDAAKNPEKLTAAIDYYKHRFGNEEGLKEALATDPAGIVADLFTILQPARAITKSNALTKLSNFDPNVAPIKAVQAVSNANIPSAITGAMTGTGSDVMHTLYKAGQEGGNKLDAALQHLRDPEGTYKELVTDAKAGVNELARRRGLEYTQGMEAIENNVTPMSFGPIEQSLKDIYAKYNFENEPSGKKSAKMQEKLQNEIEYWKNKDPAIFHTPSGIDFLKRRIGEIGEGAEFGTTPKSIANEAYGAVRKSIIDQEPDYANIMSKYADASDLLHELSGTFSLGPKARTDTSIRKLQQALRNNANTNYGYRGELMNELENAGATNLRTKIAGQAASSKMPRGLQGINTTGAVTAALATANPYTLMSIPFQSPRLMGEAAVIAGQATRYGKKGLAAIKDALEAGNIDPKLLANWVTQEQQSQSKD